MRKFSSTGLAWIARATGGDPGKGRGGDGRTDDGGPDSGGTSEQDFSVVDAIGGPRGVIESVLPGAVFVALFVATSNLGVTVMISAVVAAVQVAVRLVQRQSALGALGGLLAVAICLVWAWKSHEARNYYMFGFITNAVYLVILGSSLAVRVPALGCAVEFIRSLPTENFRGWLHEWLDDADLRHAYTIVTVLWTGVFSLRLLVQIPLYLNDQVAWLGVTRLLMGIPFWALAIWISYLLIATAMHEHRKRAVSHTSIG